MSAIRKLSRSLSAERKKAKLNKKLSRLRKRFPNHRTAFFRTYYFEFIDKYENGAICKEDLIGLLTMVFHSVLTDEMVEELATDTFTRCQASEEEGITYVKLMETAHGVWPECNTADFKPLMTFIMSDFDGDGVIDIRDMLAILSRSGDIYELGYSDVKPIQNIIDLFVHYGENDHSKMCFHTFLISTFDPDNLTRCPRIFDLSLPESFFNSGTDVITTTVLAVVMMAFVEANRYTMYCTDRVIVRPKTANRPRTKFTNLSAIVWRCDEEDLADDESGDESEDAAVVTLSSFEASGNTAKVLDRCQPDELLGSLKEAAISLNKLSDPSSSLVSIFNALDEAKSSLQDLNPDLVKVKCVFDGITERANSLQDQMISAMEGISLATATLSAFTKEFDWESLEGSNPISDECWKALLEKYNQQNLKNAPSGNFPTVSSLQAASESGNFQAVQQQVERIANTIVLEKTSISTLGASTRKAYDAEYFSSYFSRTSSDLTVSYISEINELPEHILRKITENTTQFFDSEYLADLFADFKKFAGGDRLRYGKVIHLLQQVYPECNSQEVTEKLVRFCGVEGGAVDFPSLFIAMCKLAPESKDLPLKALLTFDMCDMQGNGEMELHETLRVLSAASTEDGQMARKVTNNMKYLFEKVGQGRTVITRSEFLEGLHGAMPADAEGRVVLHTGVGVIATGVLAVANHVKSLNLLQAQTGSDK